MTNSTGQRDHFYQKLAPLYQLKVEWNNRLRKEQKLFDLLFLDRTIDHVCDLGCGDGGHAEEITRRGAQYTGIDSSAAMIAMAKNLHSQLPNVNFQRGNALGIPRKFDRAFDLVLLLGNTLPHFRSRQDLQKLFAGISRVLQDNGRFVLQTVNPGLLESQDIHFLPSKLAENTTLFTPFYVRRNQDWDFYMPI